MLISFKLLRCIKGTYNYILTYCVHKRKKCVDDIMLSGRKLAEFSVPLLFDT